MTDLIDVMCGADPVSGAILSPSFRVSLKGKAGGPDLARVDVHEVFPGGWSYGVHMPGYGRAPSRRMGYVAGSEAMAAMAGLDEILHRLGMIGRAPDFCATDRELQEIKTWAEKQKALTGEKIYRIWILAGGSDPH